MNLMLALAHARTGVVATVLVVLPSASLTTVEDSIWHVDRGNVRIVCPLTVGGSFEATTTAITGSIARVSTSPAYVGAFSVDLRTLDTGVGLRNDHLRHTYLEVDKGEGFERAVVSDIRLTDIDLDTFQGRTRFSGTLLLHGTRRTIAGELQIRRSPPLARVEATFPIVIAEYGIAKPQYLGVGVKEKVEARIELVATAAEASR